MFFSDRPDKWLVMRRAFSLRCPNCGVGKTFEGLFKVNHVCSHCGVRFEREDGESVGGMYINLSLAEVTTMGGFFLIQALFQPPWLPHLFVWIVYNIVFITVFYSRSRSLWMGISYLTGGVHRDDEEEES